MDRAAILNKVTELLHEILEDHTVTLMEETTPSAVDEWDSANHVQLILAIEDEFGIRFETAEITALENVGLLLDSIEHKLPH